MADVGLPVPASRPDLGGRWTRLVARPGFQRLMARLPFIRGAVRREGEAMFDVIAGFCQSQILMAVVKLDVPAMLLDQPGDLDDLAARCAVPRDRMLVLLRGAASIGLVVERRGQYRLTTRGAALAGVPGLQDMIAHHDVLYRDLADPVGFFRGTTETELAEFWPYVFGAGAAKDPTVAQRYSDLMAESQTLVADDTLAAINMSDVRRVMDVGGGTGAFLCALGAKHKQPNLTLFDLPAVISAAESRFQAHGLLNRVTIAPGSFRDDPLPTGADMITLVRVLYDHNDQTVLDLLKAVKAVLPSGGRLVVSEPMTGGAQPTCAGDAYFALYCMAMRTGRARSSQEIAALMQAAGFSQIKTHRPRRAFITSVIEAVN